VKAGTVVETAVTREHKGEYGYDGSFHTVSAGAQLAGIGAGSAALLAGAGFASARGNRLAAALAAASAAEILATAASYAYATRSGKFRAWDGVLDNLRARVVGLPSRTCGRPVSMPPICVNWVGTTCGVATSDGACGTAVPGSPRAWLLRRNRPNQASSRPDDRRRRERDIARDIKFWKPLMVERPCA
jgi:hypothetical protein